MPKLIAAVLVLFAALNAFGRDLYIIHIRGSHDTVNAQVTTDLETIRDGLNYKNNSHGSYYHLKNFDTFADAKQFIAGIGSAVSIGVFHGVLNQDGTPNGDVAQK